MRKSIVLVVLMALLAAFVQSASAGAVCSATGDPHYRTFDGVIYHMYTVGEFIYVASMDNTFEVQARTEYFGPWSASLHKALAFKYKGTIVAIYGARAGGSWNGDKVTLNGKVISLPANVRTTVGNDGVSILRQGSSSMRYSITFPNGVNAIVNTNLWASDDAYIDLNIEVPDTMKGKIAGMCGYYDGNSANDFIGSDGKPKAPQQPNDASATSFARSWSIEPGSPRSLFEPATGPDWENFNKQRAKGVAPREEQPWINDNVRKIAETECAKASTFFQRKNCLDDIRNGRVDPKDIPALAAEFKEIADLENMGKSARQAIEYLVDIHAAPLAEEKNLKAIYDAAKNTTDALTPKVKAQEAQCEQDRKSILLVNELKTLAARLSDRAAADQINKLLDIILAKLNSCQGILADLKSQLAVAVARLTDAEKNYQQNREARHRVINEVQNIKEFIVNASNKIAQYRAAGCTPKEDI